MFETIKYEVNDGIAYVTINRPQAMNALNTQVLDELYAAFTQFEGDADAKAAIVTGEGKAFVAGADIAQMKQLDAVAGRAMIKKGHTVMNLMESVDKPIDVYKRQALCRMMYIWKMLRTSLNQAASSTVKELTCLQLTTLSFT